MTLSTHEERVIAELEAQFSGEDPSQRFERGNETVARDRSKGAERFVRITCVVLPIIAIVLLFVGREDWFALRISAPLGLAVHQVQQVSAATGSVIVLCSVLMLARAVQNLRRARRATPD